MEAIIREFLTLSSTVPEDLASRLGQIGFEVDEELVDNKIVSPPEETTPEEHLITNDNIVSKETLGRPSATAESNIDKPDSSIDKSGSSLDKQDSSLHKPDNSMDQPDSSVKMATSSIQYSDGLPEITIKEEHTETTNYPDQKAKTKTVPKVKSVVKKSQTKRTVVDTAYVSRSGRRCKRKTMHDESDHDDETSPLNKRTKTGHKTSTTTKLDVDYASLVKCETEPNLVNSDTEESDTTHRKRKPRKKRAVKSKPKCKTDQVQQDGSENDDVTFACTFRKCDVICSNEDDVLKHIEEKHADDKSRRCQKCKRMFVTPNAKRKHTKICIERLSKDGPFVCEICGKTDIPNVAKLKEHIRNHQKRIKQRERTQYMKANGITPERKPLEKLPCEVCGKLVSRLSMTHHLSTHTKPLPCDLCNETFSQRSVLKMHKLRVHHDESLAKFRCEHCGKLFMEMAKYQHHVNSVHNKQYNHKCETCGKAFPSNNLLQIHVKVTHREKSFRCHLCTSAYGMENLLTRHIKMAHLKQVTYPCSICKERFPTPPQLSAHKKSAHLDQLIVHRCLYCSSGFQKKSHYRRHLTSVHKVKTVILDNRELKLVVEEDYESVEVEVKTDNI